MILSFFMRILPIAFLMMLSPAMASEVSTATKTKTLAGNLRSDIGSLKATTGLGNLVKLDKEELTTDSLNQVQLEDEAFWKRSMSASLTLGGEAYGCECGCCILGESGCSICCDC
jgi:hypothetical protein